MVVGCKNNSSVHKKRINKKRVFIAILILVILIFSIIGVTKKVTYLFSNEVHILENEEKYTLKIDYPIFHINKIDKKIKEYVNMKHDEFKDVVMASYKNINSKYDFILSVISNEYNSILNININTLSYTGGAHYNRDDFSLHYNKKTNEFMNISDFFIDEESFNKLDDLSYHYIMKLKETSSFMDFNEIWVRDGIIPNNSNYEHFMFKKDGLEIMFLPYQIAPWSYGEVKITIPYDKLNDLLKEEFRGDTEISKDENLIPEIRDISKFKNKKLVAFTFDDGPNTLTTKILLDNLDKYDARVTFFVLGSRIDSHSDILKRAFLQGNQIGSHTYSHKNLLLINRDSVLREINYTNEKIKEVIGEYPKLIRPPYGNTSIEIKSLSNLSTILWNVDTLDWKYRDKNKVCEEILKSARDGSIILLHDLYQSSVEGALMAMEKLQKEGYAFVTISEMASLKNIELNNKNTYFSLN